MQENTDETNFENKVKFIFNHITGYGIRSMGEDFDINEKAEEFIKKVHEGWKIAQDNIVDELIIIEKTRKENKKNLTEAHIKKDEILTQKFIQDNKTLEFNERILRKLADSIAWQILRSHHIVRRFCISNELQTIQPSNLKREKKFVDSYNENNPLSFALLSDITSFLQIGDALIWNFEEECTVAVVELKDGELNEKIMEAVDGFYKTGGCKRYFGFFKEKYGESAAKQFERMVKQDSRGSRLIQTITEGKGIDPLGDKIEIPEPIFPSKYFVKNVKDLLEGTNIENFSLGCVDDCLYIGVYSSKYPVPLDAFKYCMKGLGINYPIYNFRNTLLHQVTISPFILPLPKEQIFDLIFGRKLILFCLDFDKWMKLGEQFNLNIEWLGRKESSKITTGMLRLHRPFELGNKIIKVSYGNTGLYVGGGALARVFYEFMNPTCIHSMNKMSFDCHNNLDAKI